MNANFLTRVGTDCSDLWVVTAVFNPWRYKSRVHLYNEFKKYVADSGANLVTVELAYGARPFEVTSSENRFDIQLRTDAELWHKERMLNLGIQRLPPDWKYVAWIDADVVFARPDWAKETIHMLQHYPILQMFSQAQDLTPKNEQLKLHTGIIYAYQEGLMGDVTHRYDHFHPGFAWAARRDALDNLGGLFDTAVLGSADRHMALSFIERVEKSYPKGISRGYFEQLDMWQERSKRHIRKNVGYMPGLVMHYWHGKKVDRRYSDRWKILVKHQYDPEFDLKFDTQGLYQFTDRCPSLQYDIRRYFQARNEDSIDL
jgi:hypothetical protein